MLTLDASTRTFAGVELAADDEDPLAFWILPPQHPRITLVEGTPQISLLRLVRDGVLVSGHLTLKVDLAIPESALDAARAELAEAIHCEPDQIRLRPVMVIAASAELLFVGRETDVDGALGPLIRKKHAIVTPILDAPYVAAFSVALSSEGVRLVEAAMRSGAAPMGIAYRLDVEALRPGLRIVAHVDWSRVYEHLSSAVKEGWLFAVEDIQRITEKLVENRVVRLDVIQAIVPEGESPAPPPDLGPALLWMEREIVEKCCEPVMTLSREPARASLGTFGDMFGVGTSFAVKSLTQIERATADVSFDRATVVVRTLGATAHLVDLFGGAPPDEHISDGGDTSPFFERTSLHLTTARPLADTFVREVVARFRYGATEIPIHLTADTPSGSAETWADQAPERTWTLALEAVLMEDAPVDPGAVVVLPTLSGQGRELTLDLERLLGLRSIEVQSAPDERVVATRVEFAILRSGERVGQPAEATVTTKIPRKTAWLRDIRPGDRIDATTRHMLADGRIIDLAPIPVETRILRLPPPFPGAMTVQIWADNDWSELSAIIVSLQKSGDQPVGIVKLDKAGASAAIRLDLPDPTDRSYRYKAARELKDGGVEEDAWITTDRTALLVGRVAANKLLVDVTPVGLELPQAGILAIEVELRYVDAPNRISEVTKTVIRARADRFRWDVAIKDPAARSYDYQITIHRSSGATEVMPWVTTADRVLLVVIGQAPRVP